MEDQDQKPSRTHQLIFPEEYQEDVEDWELR